MKVITIFQWKIEFFLILLLFLTGVVVGQVEILGYFGDQFGGNQDGKFDLEEMSDSHLTRHHLGAVLAVTKLKLDKESVLGALFASDKRKEQNPEYGESFKAGDVGLAVLAKADKFNLINGLFQIKGGKEELSTDTLVNLNMAELSASYLMIKHQWQVEDLRELLSSPDGREGLTLFIKAAAWEMSWRKEPTYSYTSVPDINLPYENEVIDAITVLSGKPFSPAALAALPERVFGINLTNKIEMILREAGLEV